MAESSSSASGGIGLCGLLTVVFVSAKVFGFEPVASWSWWWVFCPLWIGFAVVLGILAVVGAGLLIAATIATVRNSRAARRRRLQRSIR